MASYFSAKPQTTRTTVEEGLDIDLKLIAVGFPDDKIYGSIIITPDDDRDSIETLKLVIDKKKELVVDKRTRDFSIFGFRSVQEKRSIRAEATYKTEDNSMRTKMSTTEHFHFTGKSQKPNPIVSAMKSTGEKSSKTFAVNVTFKPAGKIECNLICLYLDDKLVERVQAPNDNKPVKFFIENLSEEEYSLQIRTFFAGEQTYESEIVKFDLSDFSDPSEEILNIGHERLPRYLLDVDMGGRVEDFTKKKKTNSCYCRACKHDGFPGFEHYFKKP